MIGSLLVAIAALQLGAGVGLAYVAGFGEVEHTLVQFRWPWVAVMLGALCVSYVGYHYAYHGLFHAEGGPAPAPRHLRAVVVAAFCGFLAYYGTKLDHSVLRSGGADDRECSVRTTALSGLEYGALSIGGCVAAIAVLVVGLSRPPGDFTMPWAVIPVPGFLVAFWAAVHYRDRLPRHGGWLGRLGVFLRSIDLVRALFAHPVRNVTPLLGMAVFWAGDIAAVWTGMAAFGFRMNVAQLVVGFATGMVFTRRTGPLAGAGPLLLAMAVSVWYSGAPLAVAVAGIGVYRLVCVWAPLPFSLAHIPALREVVEPEPAGLRVRA